MGSLLDVVREVCTPSIGSDPNTFLFELKKSGPGPTTMGRRSQGRLRNTAGLLSHFCIGTLRLIMTTPEADLKEKD